MKFKQRTLCGLVLALTAVLGCQEGKVSAVPEAEAAAPAAEKAAPVATEASLDAVKEQISKAWKAARPNITIQKVEKTEMDGIYLVSLGAREKFFSTADGRNFIAGDLYRVEPGNIVNVTEESRNGIRAEAMASIKEDEMIIFSPKGEVKSTMYVFTDVDCGYCRLLHSKVPEMNEMGIEVRYLAYPRAGMNSNSYKKIASAWCAEDKHDALTKLKNQEQIPTNVCDGNPVASQYHVGQQIGLTGTPALVLENGRLIAGYVEPAKLGPMLGL